MTSPLHTKLKELRELRERSGICEVYVDSRGRDFGVVQRGKDEFTAHGMSFKEAHFFVLVANNWLTLIEALEKATTEMQTVLNVVSKHDTGQREYGSSDYEFATKRLSKALAEIAEMLEGK